MCLVSLSLFYSIFSLPTKGMNDVCDVCLCDYRPFVACFCALCAFTLLGLGLGQVMSSSDGARFRSRFVVEGDTF